jgi:hypothetical protein
MIKVRSSGPLTRQHKKSRIIPSFTVARKGDFRCRGLAGFLIAILRTAVSVEVVGSPWAIWSFYIYFRKETLRP